MGRNCTISGWTSGGSQGLDGNCHTESVGNVNSRYSQFGTHSDKLLSAEFGFRFYTDQNLTQEATLGDAAKPQEGMYYAEDQEDYEATDDTIYTWTGAVLPNSDPVRKFLRWGAAVRLNELTYDFQVSRQHHSGQIVGQVLGSGIYVTSTGITLDMDDVTRFFQNVIDSERTDQHVYMPSL
ncbi:hypothetical protein SAMN05444515_10364 [Ectothiorhodospira marina]|uniref:Uncharacterized protein n=2 Tax=Ectothiorhodospira marina TaxID=1396821 RepID=A0A1H7I8T4_9GAMM|nr:hypothetical protein SAMN05444515_10364 [Ectothiorhodospira marina]